MKTITIYLLTFLLQVVAVLSANNLNIRTISGLTYSDIQFVEIRDDSLVLLMNTKQYVVALSEIETVHESLHPRPLLLIGGGCALGLFVASQSENSSGHSVTTEIAASVENAFIRPIIIAAVGGLGAIGGAIVSITRARGRTSKFSQMNSFDQDRLLKSLSRKYGYKIDNEPRKSP